MNCTKMMLTVLMDGIKDAGMLLDYAESAKEAEKSDETTWFKNHAKKRIDSLETDYEWVKDYIGLEAKMKAGDEIASALDSHIESQIDELKRRMQAV